MHLMKQGCKKGQTIKDGIKYMHSDFQFLKKYLWAIAAVQVVVGYAGCFMFAPIRETYPLLTSSLVCFGQNWTLTQFNQTVNGTMVEAFGCDRIVAMNAFCLAVAGFGLHFVAYMESFQKAKIWLNFYIIQCMPSLMALLAAVRFLFGPCGENIGDIIETGIKGCQIFIITVLLLWNILIVYIGYVFYCFMIKLYRRKQLRKAMRLYQLYQLSQSEVI